MENMLLILEDGEESQTSFRFVFFFPPVILQNVLKLGEVSKQGKLFKLRLQLSLKAVYKCSEEVSWDKALKF